MSQGFSYVPVRAGRADGSNGNGSYVGNPGGTETSGYYIHWDTVGGFTGVHGWDAISDSIASTGFPALVQNSEYGYTGTYTEFLQYVEGDLEGFPFPGNLDAVLGDAVWASGAKITFISNHVASLGISGVVAANDPYRAHYNPWVIKLDL